MGVFPAAIADRRARPDRRLAYRPSESGWDRDLLVHPAVQTELVSSVMRRWTSQPHGAYGECTSTRLLVSLNATIEVTSCNIPRLVEISDCLWLPAHL
jgi:hypothetical protein